MSAFFRQLLENLRPTPLMDVMAYMIFVLPSMLVFITRRMCWNWVGTTRDILEDGFYGYLMDVRGCEMITCPCSTKKCFKNGKYNCFGDQHNMFIPALAFIPSYINLSSRCTPLTALTSIHIQCCRYTCTTTFTLSNLWASKSVPTRGSLVSYSRQCGRGVLPIVTLQRQTQAQVEAANYYFPEFLPWVKC